MKVILQPHDGLISSFLTKALSDQGLTTMSIDRETFDNECEGKSVIWVADAEEGSTEISNITCMVVPSEEGEARIDALRADGAKLQHELSQ